ncbi:hypothetical protein RJ55_08266 [Drechmeria coniospora]|nr:hypothetical protein RJ55_08266 [Drechmeria coniospora]
MRVENGSWQQYPSLDSTQPTHSARANRPAEVIREKKKQADEPTEQTPVYTAHYTCAMAMPTRLVLASGNEENE